METADIVLFSSIALMQLTFLGIPYFINESNAKDYLAGYNMLSEEDRDNYDLKGYLVFQKKFLTQYSWATSFIFIISYFTFCYLDSSHHLCDCTTHSLTLFYGSRQ